MLTIPPAPESRVVCKIMWKKFGRFRRATDDNNAHALCMLDDKG
jgi:hypothetical protein